MRSQMQRINLRITSVPAIILISDYRRASLMTLPSPIDPQHIIQFVHNGLKHDVRRLHASHAAEQLRLSRSRHQVPPPTPSLLLPSPHPPPPSQLHSLYPNSPKQPYP